MATKIKLMRLGKMRAPYYRIVVADARAKRDGRAIETIGKYHPKEDPSFIEVDSDRAQYWLSVGAQPTEPVAAILRVTGDWQRFKGEPPPPPMKTKAPRPDKRTAFEEAARSAEAEARPATTPRKRASALAAPVAEGGSDRPGRASDQPAEASGTASPATPANTATEATSSATAPAAEQ